MRSLRLAGCGCGCGGGCGAGTLEGFSLRKAWRAAKSAALSVGRVAVAVGKPVALAPLAVGRVARTAIRSGLSPAAVWGQLRSELREVAPALRYTSIVVGFVPGIGTGIAAGLAAGSALAEGRPLTDAIVAGVRGAVPGGALGRAVFDAGIAVASGKRIDAVAFDAVAGQLPDGAAREAFGVVRRVAAGERIDAAVIDQARSHLPAEVGRALDLGVAVGHGREVQAGRARPVALSRAALRRAATSERPTFTARDLVPATSRRAVSWYGLPTWSA